MKKKKRDMLIQQLNYFKSLAVVQSATPDNDDNRYGVIAEDGSEVVPTKYRRAEIYLRVNRHFPFTMKPVIWVVNDDHKQAYIGPNLKEPTRFKNYTSLFDHNSGNSLSGFIGSVVDAILYEDIYIQRIEPEKVMTYSYKKGA